MGICQGNFQKKLTNVLRRGILCANRQRGGMKYVEFVT
nr:MAG TPA: hypothetical protein [Caudoviricetes sp.]